jgi:hypothetical protein
MIRIGVSKTKSVLHEPVIIKTIVRDPDSQLINNQAITRDKPAPTKL